MTENKIKILRKSVPLTLKELAIETNKNLEMKYETLLENVTEEEPQFGNIKKIKVTDSQLSLYENGKRTPRHSIIWRALADVFDVPLPYLLGYTEIKDDISIESTLSEEAMAEKQKNSRDFHKHLLTKDKKEIDAFYELSTLARENELNDYEIELKEFLGNQKFNKFKNQYTIYIGSQKNERTFLNILEVLNLLSGSNNQVDLQLMLSFIQLNKENQKKALEQVKNLLIVQNATEHIEEKDN